jgi:Mg-chelatase subunit ChlI
MTLPAKFVCAFCGTENTGTNICRNCGLAFDTGATCPSCKNVVSVYAVSCTICGAKFMPAALECGNCGARLSPYSQVCEKCGFSYAVTEKIEKIEKEVTVEKESEMPPIPSEPEPIQQLDIRLNYPFTAIVGQEDMKLALILNGINPDIGGVLIQGEKGTAKTIAIRSLPEILPEIDVIKGCRYSCDPYEPKKWCSDCKSKYKEHDKIPIISRPVRVVDLPLNASEDRIVGTIDIEKILKEGLKTFQPGILADVNRGILYIDEINLLEDFAVDLLLDSAATGVCIVERENLSIQYPAKFIIIGSMNPEEGGLRPQLIDRIALNVSIKGLTNPYERIEIVKRSEQFLQDPVGFRERYADMQANLKSRIIAAKNILPAVKLTDKMGYIIAQVALNFKVHGHRADIIISKTAQTIAAFEGRTEVTLDDIVKASELALPHRMRTEPFETEEFSTHKLKSIVNEICSSLPRDLR